MSKNDSHDNDLSLQSCDFLAWRVIRDRQRYEAKQKKKIYLARPRQRSENHEIHH